MPPLATGTVIAGRYRLERALARGAMGSVWVGRHLQLDVPIAVKLMAPELASSPDLRARFEREAKAAALLRSPNAVHVYDHGIDDGAPYIVMELLEGEDLEARLAREPRLPLPATLLILAQVGKALRRAHEVGLIHRDLKPANVFLARQGGEEIVKVVDFGIAKSTGVIQGAQATRTGALLGTPSYMSPEQIRSSTRVDARSDLWSLAVIAFRCVTGRLPFPGEELGEVLVDVCTAPIPLASEAAPDLDPAVDAFFQRALERDPEQRFQSADDLVEAFASLPGARGALSFEAAPTSAPVSSRSPGGTMPGPVAAPLLAPTVAGAPPGVATLSTHHPAAATLSPSAQTRPGAVTPLRRGRAPLLFGAALGVLALGLGLYALLRAPAPQGSSTPPPAAAQATSTVVPAEAPAGPSVSAQVPEPAPLPDVIPSAAPSASASAQPQAPSRPAGKPRGRPPARSAPSSNGEDLLQHM